MKYGERIAELRISRGYTQEQFSRLIGVSRAALSHYEKNRREPDNETLVKIADLLQVSVDYLVGRTEEPQDTAKSEVRQFANSLELSDEELLKTFKLTIDGKELTREEAKRFIAFVRAERSLP